MTPKRNIIGLTGHKGSGKDEAATALVQCGFVHLKFAMPLKLMLRSLLNFRQVNPAEIERMIEGDLKEVDTSALDGRSPRHAMQTLGTEWGRREIGDDLWTGVVRDRAAKEMCHVVISDVRFPNEAEMVRALGGEVWRIARPGCAGDGHTSETEMESIEPDTVIWNDGPSAFRFRSEVTLIWQGRFGAH